MPAPTRFPLLGFSAWLQAKGKSPSTGVMYTRAARAILYACDGSYTDLALVREYVTQRNHGASWLSMLTSAWNAFRAYVLEGGGVALPGIYDPAEAPPVVQDAILLLISGVGLPVSALLLAEWRHVESAGMRIRDPRARYAHTARIAPPPGPRLLRHLLAWARPPSENAPLVPLHPGSMDPRPPGALRADRAAAKARQDREGTADRPDLPTPPEGVWLPPGLYTAAPGALAGAAVPAPIQMLSAEATVLAMLAQLSSGAAPEFVRWMLEASADPGALAWSCDAAAAAMAVGQPPSVAVRAAARSKGITLPSEDSASTATAEAADA